jgi:hypothetical protein
MSPLDLAFSGMQTRNIKSTRLPDLLCAVLLVSFALAIAYPRWRAGIDWRDEGFLAYGAVRVAQGEIPHRDFVSLQPPLSFYTTAGVFKLFGTSLASLRIFGLSIYLLLPLLIYGVGRSFRGPIPFAKEIETRCCSSGWSASPSPLSLLSSSGGSLKHCQRCFGS